MDVLWRRQVDLTTILKSLPADSLAISRGAFVREGPVCSPHPESHEF